MKKLDSLLTTMEFDLTINGLSTSSQRIANEKEDIRLSPNPVIDYVTINHPFEELSHIEIFNVLGQRMGQMEAKADNQYDVSFLPPNIYFIKVQPKKGQALTKLMVKAGN
jgi:hypothetical protein